MTALLAQARSFLAASGDVPPQLMARMTEALDEALDEAAHPDAPADAAPADLPDLLGAAAMACLRLALERCDERYAALHLLAADALITAACEAAAGGEDADAAVARLRALCDEFAVHRLSAAAGAA
jgi:hypothetical protein